MKLSLIVALSLSSLLACRTDPPKQPPAPEGDGLGSPIGDACKHLRDLKCKEGSGTRGRTCFQTMTNAADVLGVSVPSECLIKAVSQEAVRECGSAETIRVTCKPMAAGGAS